MLIGSIISIAMPELIIKMFKPDEELLKYGVEALRVIGISFLLSTVSVVASGMFEGLGKGKMSFIISGLRQLAILVPLGWALSRFWGAVGVWISFPISEAVTFIISMFMLRHLYKHSLKENKEDTLPAEEIKAEDY